MLYPIVGTSAGGAADHTARMLQKLLQGTGEVGTPDVFPR